MPLCPRPLQLKRFRGEFEREGMDEMALGLVGVTVSTVRGIPHTIPRREIAGIGIMAKTVALRAPKEHLPMAEDVSLVASVDLRITTKEGGGDVGWASQSVPKSEW